MSATVATHPARAWCNTSANSGREVAAVGAEYITSMFLARSNKYFSYVASRRPQWSILGADTLDRKSPGGGIRQFSIKGERSSKHAFADRTERDSAVAQLPGWAEVQGRDAIYKSFRFSDFNEAFAFMARAAMVSEKMDHHPEWFNVYSRVDVTLATHDLGGVSRKDVKLAKRLDEFARSA